MKIPVAPIEKEELPGDPESEWKPNVFPHVMGPPMPTKASEIKDLNAEPDDRDHAKAGERVKHYFEKGYYTRAVVTGRLASTLNDVNAQCDPESWGIVLEFHPYRALPLEIQWADGQHTFEDMERVVLIYPGCSHNEMRAHILGRKQVH